VRNWLRCLQAGIWIRFSFKVKEQEKSPRKVYAIDTGLANTIGFRFSENTGKLTENLVFWELKRKQAINPELELYYWSSSRYFENLETIGLFTSSLHQGLRRSLLLSSAHRKFIISAALCQTKIANRHDYLMRGGVVI
jgi:hypothetical protein